MHLRATFALTLILAVLIGSATAGPPHGGGPHSGKPRAGGQGGGGSAGKAAEQARRNTGGRVLSVREQGAGYEVKVLTPAGEVRSVFVPGTQR